MRFHMHKKSGQGLLLTSELVVSIAKSDQRLFYTRETRELQWPRSRGAGGGGHVPPNIFKIINN